MPIGRSSTAGAPSRVRLSVPASPVATSFLIPDSAPWKETSLVEPPASPMSLAFVNDVELASS